MTNSYEAFKTALKTRESSGDYTAVNSFGYLGAYQFGEAALVDLGFVVLDDNPYDNDFNGGWTGKMGINSAADFLNSPAAQEAAADEWFELLWDYAVALDLDAYLGQTVGGVYITASAIIAGAHLLGAGGVATWLNSGGTIEIYDGYGTPISEYLALFSGYEMPFETGEEPGDLIPGVVLIGDAGDDDLSGTDSDDILTGNGGRDRLSGLDGDDDLNGGDGVDVLLGGAGDDVLAGGDAFDFLIGGDGGDTMFGGASRDLLVGQAGRDEISGGAGDDILIGGAGTDLFYFNDGDGNDRVLDFDPTSTGDVVVLSGNSEITDYADLRDNHMVQQGGNVVIDDGQGNSITLIGLTLAELEANDFVF